MGWVRSGSPTPGRAARLACLRDRGDGLLRGFPLPRPRPGPEPARWPAASAVAARRAKPPHADAAAPAKEKARLAAGPFLRRDRGEAA
jgi:hypothetical protein